MTFVVVDIETTGLSRHRHSITEIAAMKVDQGKVLQTYHSMVNPKQNIPRFITKLTGITNEMVKDAPTIQNVLPHFLQFLGNHIFVAHNATFDYNFINHNARMYHDIQLQNHALCTRRLASRLMPELTSKRLGSLCDVLNIQNTQAHRAMSDVAATVQLLHEFLSMLHCRGIQESEHVLLFQELPIEKARRILSH